MRYLRSFESLDNISPDDIDDYLIDYIQMGFETDISVGSSYILDFSKINKDKDYIGSYEMDSYNKGISNSSLTISLRSNNKSSYKISELEEAYDMLESFLKDEFGLLPNYIMLNGSINRFSYFENFDHIKRFSESVVRTPNQINTHSIIFGFYKPVTPPYKIKKLSTIINNMKYLKRYNKILESKSSNSDPKSVKIPSNYYLPIKHWDYQLGDLWSPKVNIGGSKGVPFHSRNDSHVNRVDIVDDGMSNTLSNRSVQHLFSEHLGESNLDELCEFYLRDLGYDYGPKDEFSFLMKGLIEKRCYVIISVPGKPDIIQQVPDFKKNYLDIVGDIIGHKFTDKERKDISDGKDSKYYGGSWHINVGLYDVSGIKLISTDMGGNNCYILKRNDMERLIDMTKTYNLYRFEDKDLQLLRMNGRRIEYHIISDIFIDVSDNGMVLEDFNQIGPNLLMVKFMKDNAQFDDKLVKEISDGIDRFESVYNCKLYRIDLTRNNLMYVNDSNKTWLLKDRPVLSFNNPEELLSVGTMEYDVHLRKHAVYFLFEV